jgi:YggT family protein
MDQALGGYHAFLGGLRVALFWVALALALLAVMDWAVRTRKVNPFGPIGRFCRRFVDPIMAPVERRVVRHGGLPSNAPWWALAVVIVGGILLLALLDFLGRFSADVAFGLSSPARFGMLILMSGFSILRIALIVRVISSWIRMSPYSIWIRWSFVLTEWMLAPLRKVIPMLGPVDITPLVAFILLGILQSVLL